MSDDTAKPQASRAARRDMLLGSAAGLAATLIAPARAQQSPARPAPAAGAGSG
jgi:hypothetical protein